MSVAGMNIVLIEVVHGKRPKVTLDLTSNSPLLYNDTQGSLEGKVSSLSAITLGYFPGIPLQLVEKVGHFLINHKVDTRMKIFSDNLCTVTSRKKLNQV